MTVHSSTAGQVRSARSAARDASRLGPETKRRFLHRLADTVTAQLPAIREANDEDVRTAGRSASRVPLRTDRLERIVDGLRWLAESSDPIGQVSAARPQPNGLLVGCMRVPLGVVAAVYEARPEITLEMSAMAVKSGNAAVLRGGRESLRTNRALADLVRGCLAAENISPDTVQYLAASGRDAVWDLLTGPERLDLVVVRGGDALVEEARRRSPYPILASGAGNCHIYLDSHADLGMATEIVLNAKLSAPAMCNAVETVLVHQKLAGAYLPALLHDLHAAGIEVRGCPVTCAAGQFVTAAVEQDWGEEYLDLRLAVRVVPGLSAAVDHITTYGSGHSEAIVTHHHDHALRFQREVDAAAVYVNASTRFTYGYEFGLGPMLGISTQKLHARGPVGVHGLTSQKYVVTGSGQVRQTP